MAVVCMIGIWLAAGALVAAADFALTDDKSWTKALGYLALDTIVCNMSALFILRMVFACNTIVNPPSYLTPFGWKYFLFALAIGLVYLVCKFAAKGFLSIQPDHSKMSRGRIALMVLATILGAGGAFLLIGAWWFRDFYGIMTPEQFMFNFASPVGGAEEGAMLDLYSRPVFLVCFVVALIVLLLVVPAKIGFKGQKERYFTRKARQNVTIVACALLCVGGVGYAYHTLDLGNLFKQYLVKSTYIQDNYVDPKTVKLTFPEQKRNLVHIYFESAETSYLDKANGGYMDKSLMPDLVELANTGVHFSNTDFAFGGPHQMYGTSWSVAGMTNMNFGMPLKAPGGNNNYGLDGNFLPGATGYTDLLAAQGYNETIMFGADAHFGGLDAFYTTHGTKNIFDLMFARNTGLIPPDYKVWWGFEDNKLYEYAKAEMTRLYNLGQPFCFMMENADTHYPDGFVEPETKDIFGNQYANVIFNSQKQVVDLVKWIQEQPFGANTTIVITGDHLSMDKNFFKDWDPAYERTTFNVFINPAFPHQSFETKNRQYASWDYFPTILSSLGVQIEGERLGMGTNLASDQQTLIERDGKDKVEEQTSLYSDFYTKHLLMGTGK